MSEKERLFFTVDEALEAVRTALTRYPSQLNLIAVIWPMAFGEQAYVQPDGRRQAAWVKVPGRAQPVLMGETELKQCLVQNLKRSPPPLERLARLCALVFGARCGVRPGPDPDAPAGIWIETQMADFVCTQCGRCCLTLNYRDGCSLSDYRRWQELGRSDILAWVGTVEQAGRIIACRIWIEPGTNRYAQRCPWLKATNQPHRWTCTIHAVRPTICRSYPGSRKHARMTGCRGV